MTPTPIAVKWSRLKSGLAPRVLDLFSGCGGLSLGFHAAGYEIVGSVEIDSLAASSHGLNFHGDIAAPIGPMDITTVEAEEVVAKLTPNTAAADAVDVIVGGPPCQAFARVGRAKLREVRDDPTAFRQDPRGNLYLRYLGYVEQLKPLAILMENVPDAINYGGHNVAEETCEALASMGYIAKYTLLNAVYYGVPQLRERMFLIAYAREVADAIHFPEPTRWFDVPKGYEGSRQVALKHVRVPGAERQLGLLPHGNYVPPPRAHPTLPRAVTTQEALRDLPPITAHLAGQMRRGARRLDEFVAYRRDIPSDYSKLMRTWRGFESSGGVYDHVIRSLSERDFEIFRRMKPGDEYPQAHRIAIDIFQEHLEQCDSVPSAAMLEKLKRRYVPPYDATKFPNKWRKMDPRQPARTLMAHLGKDGYSHIHYDSRQARTISVREAARLMSFPDGFRFAGTMNPAFRQIGNAVPPLMALALAQTMGRVLRGSLWNDRSLLSA